VCVAHTSLFAPWILGEFFRFHIRCISIHKLLYFIFFSTSIYTTILSAGVATSVCMLLLLLLLLLLYDMDVSCHRPFLPGTSLEPAVIPTAQASSFTLQYFPYYL